MQGLILLSQVLIHSRLIGQISAQLLILLSQILVQVLLMCEILLQLLILCGQVAIFFLLNGEISFEPCGILQGSVQLLLGLHILSLLLIKLSLYPSDLLGRVVKLLLQGVALCSHVVEVGL